MAFAMHIVQAGQYELKLDTSNLYLNSVDALVYNGEYDDALVLEGRPSRLGKWEIERAGKGYTIKQMSSGLYCTLPEAEQFRSQPVVLSRIPTVWAIEYEDARRQTIRISWPSGKLLWIAPANEAKLRLDIQTTPPMFRSIWQLKPLGPNFAFGNIIPGVYALKNKASGTYVSLAPDEKTIGCWPKADLARRGTKMWEIIPCGGGYTIRLHGADKYCTLQAISWGSAVSVSTVPAAWKIVAADSPSVTKSFWFNSILNHLYNHLLNIRDHVTLHGHMDDLHVH